MSSGPNSSPDTLSSRPAMPLVLCGLLASAGLIVFVSQLFGGNAARAWQSYLVSFLLFSAIAHGAVLFSTLMHSVGARWSGPLAGLAEAFTSFFPVSFVLFLVLFIGRKHLFPWLGHDLHGKEVWLNLPFLFSRDAIGLLLLYGLGLAYLYHVLGLKQATRQSGGPLAQWLSSRWQTRPPEPGRFHRRATVLAFLYMFVFAVVLSLIGYDLVMSMDPHWYSTLFGAYSFVKAIYVGFGALIITAALLQLSGRSGFSLASSHYHDIGKLFFAFGLVWADFFYAQFVVIWYGNISEETAYIIERTMTAPWSVLAWAVLAICFIAPFLILLNKRIKTIPAAMIVICGAVIVGMWLEHFLLLGPVFHHGAERLPLSWIDPLVALGFLGLLAASVTFYLRQFPAVLMHRLEDKR